MIKPGISIKGKLTAPINVKGKTNMSIIRPKLEGVQITPSAEDQVLVSSLDGFSEVVVKGDVNLKASNIKTGVSIFDVAGTAVNTDDATAEAFNVDKGEVAYTNEDRRIKGTYPIANSEAFPFMFPFKQNSYNDHHKCEYISLSKMIPLVQERYGEIGDVIEVDTSKLPVDITGKSIFLRFITDNDPYYNGNYWAKLQLFVAPAGSRFQQRRSSSEDIVWCHSGGTLGRINFDGYQITQTGKGVTYEQIIQKPWQSLGSLYSHSPGKCHPTWYVFATETMYSGGGSGLTRGDIVNGHGDDCILKITGNNNGYASGGSIAVPKLKLGGKYYIRLDNAALAKTLGLVPENIRENVKYLGVTGSLKDKVMTEEDFNLCLGLTKDIRFGIDFYEQLEYITFTGGQYLDLGIPLWSNANWKIETEVSFNGFHNYQHLYSVSEDDSFHEIWADSTRNFYVRLADGNKQGAGQLEANIKYTLVNEFENGTCKTYVDGTLKNNTNFGAFSVDTNLRFGKRASGLFMGNLYGIKLYSDNTLIADLVPAVESETGKVCMYDKVRGKFILNAGTGEFSCPSVEEEA